MIPPALENQDLSVAAIQRWLQQNAYGKTVSVSITCPDLQFPTRTGWWIWNPSLGQHEQRLFDDIQHDNNFEAELVNQFVTNTPTLKVDVDELRES